MLTFPQLSTGAAGQFPLWRSRRKRTILNALADGRTIRSGGECGEVIWQLDLSELSGGERNAIEQLFAESEGRLRKFTFLDPAGNLLRHSERLDEPAWTKDPLLAITAGAADPMGSSRAFQLANAGQGSQGIRQRLEVPSSFMYCWSVWIKGAGTATLSFGSLARTYPVSDFWTRLVLGGCPSGTEEAVTFRLDLGSATVVDIFGCQVEPQPGASTYKATGAVGGVYPTARFGSDSLAITADGPDRERALLRIVALTEN